MQVSHFSVYSLIIHLTILGYYIFDSAFLLSLYSGYLDQNFSISCTWNLISKLPKIEVHLFLEPSLMHLGH